VENVQVEDQKKRRAKFLIGGALVALTLVALTVWAMARPGSTAFYKTTSELVAMGPSAAGAEGFRVNGKVVPDSIERDGLRTTFRITDGSSEVTILTDQALPDTFREHADVIAEGSFDGSLFTARHVSAKCPSKFKAKA
jgi:cytochrome c-type biogenesis protein CcmE